MSEQPHEHEPPTEREGASPSEEELRARLEEELRKIKVRDVLVQTAVTLINLGGHRLGLTAESADVRDLEQARTAIEAVRAILPLAEQEGAEQLRPLRDALSQLQLAYAQEVGTAAEPGGGDAPAGTERAGGDRPPRSESDQPSQQRSPGRLWVPPGSTG